VIRACVLGALLAGPALAQGLPRTAPEAVGLSPEKLRALDEALRRDVDAGAIAGTVALLARGGRIAHVLTEGFADLERHTPIREDTIFRVASFSKAATSVAAMMLVEEGRLALEDPLSKYLPAFRRMTVAGPDSPVPARREITIRDVLVQTSGLSYGYGPATAAWKEAGVQGWSFAHRPEPLSTLVDRIAKLPLDAQPGEKWIYGVSTDVLGRVIEVASGQSLDAFLKTRVFGPLKMAETFFFVPKEKSARLAVVYAWDGQRLVRAPEGGGGQGGHLEGPRLCFGGGAGLVSTALDWARFLQMLLNGGVLDGVRILQPRSVAAMTMDQAGGLYPVAGVGWGFGFEVVSRRGRTDRASSPGEFSWGSAYDGGYLVDRRDGLLALFLAQRLPERGPKQRAAFSELVYPTLVAPRPPPEPR
jgi:CubicO group peptidase (beta-lactamase class C family)